MPESSEDFWLPGLTSEPKRSPLSILREQAENLASKTNHDVIAEVETTASQSGDFDHSFYLVALCILIITDIVFSILRIMYIYIR